MGRKMLISFFSGLIVTFVLLSECTAASAPALTSTPDHWTYEGEECTTHYGNLSPEYTSCSTGKSQFPVDISNAAPKDIANLVFHYQPSQLNILNNGHTIQVNYDAGSYVELDGVRYDLLQFHFHAPS